MASDMEFIRNASAKDMAVIAGKQTLLGIAVAATIIGAGALAGYVVDKFSSKKKSAKAEKKSRRN